MLKILIAVAVSALPMLCAAPVAAHEFKKDGLLIGHPWARPSIGEAKVGSAYLSITNNGSGDDKLLAAKATVSSAVELHTHIVNSDVVKMRRVEGGVAAPSGATVKFEPGGLHVMLIGLKQTLSEGASFPMTLVFEKAGEMVVEVKVEKGPQQESSGHHHH